MALDLYHEYTYALYILLQYIVEECGSFDHARR